VSSSASLSLSTSSSRSGRPLVSSSDDDSSDVSSTSAASPFGAPPLLHALSLPFIHNVIAEKFSFLPHVASQGNGGGEGGASVVQRKVAAVGLTVAIDKIFAILKAHQAQQSHDVTSAHDLVQAVRARSLFASLPLCLPSPLALSVSRSLPSRAPWTFTCARRARSSTSASNSPPGFGKRYGPHLLSARAFSLSGTRVGSEDGHYPQCAALRR